MRNPRGRLLVLACLLASGMNAAAQDQAPPSPGGFPPRGFSSQMLVSQLSLYLPEEATRGMNRGFPGRANGPGSQEGQPGPGAGGTGPSAGGAGPGAGGSGRPQLQIPRDPKLFLTREQIRRLLPILAALRDNPLPTPAKARQVRADVDAVLTAAQKDEWVVFQKRLQDLIQRFRQQAGANSPPGASRGPDASSGQAGTGAAPQATLLQRRQKQLDAFIKVLQDRLSAADA